MTAAARRPHNRRLADTTRPMPHTSPVPLEARVRGEDGFRNRGAEVTRMEAFLDAAFAFAVTLMVISIDEIPKSREELMAALKSVPAFGASFLLIALFWRGHADWSRRYGINDRASQRHGLLLVFLVLVFIYPLRMVFGAFFDWATGGWLPANLSMGSADDVRFLFVVFAIAFGSMGGVLLMLHVHAWRVRGTLALDALETVLTRLAVVRWSMIPLFALVSLALATWMPVIPGHSWTFALPGCVFFGLHITQVALRLRENRLVAQLAPEVAR